MPIRVLLVEEAPEVRSLLRGALRLRGGFEVCGEADDGAHALVAARQCQPDVIVLDLELPGLGQELIPGLREVAPQTQIVVFTGAGEADRLTLTRQVDGYVGKDRDISYLVDLLDELGRNLERSAVLDLPPERQAAAVARRFVRDLCDEWGCQGTVEEALVVASELVTNAVVHARTPSELRVWLTADVLRLEVVDEGVGMPDPHPATEDDESGRGLLLVSGLCASWGVEALPDGSKTVWAELRLAPADEPPVAGTGAA